MLEFGNAQVGVFTGIDMLSGSNPIFDSYIYRNKPWVSRSRLFYIYGKCEEMKERIGNNE